jgi:hypothetical protein
MLVQLIIVKKLKAIWNNMWKKILLAGHSMQRGVGSSKPILIILKWGRVVVCPFKRVFPAQTKKTMNCFYFEFEKRSSVRTYKPWLAHFSKKNLFTSIYFHRLRKTRPELAGMFELTVELKLSTDNNTKGGLWPPVWLAWNQLYDNWQFLFLFAKQTNPN